MFLLCVYGDGQRSSRVVDAAVAGTAAAPAVYCFMLAHRAAPAGHARLLHVQRWPCRAMFSWVRVHGDVGCRWWSCRAVWAPCQCWGCSDTSVFAQVWWRHGRLVCDGRVCHLCSRNAGIGGCADWRLRHLPTSRLLPVDLCLSLHNVIWCVSTTCMYTCTSRYQRPLPVLFIVSYPQTANESAVKIWKVHCDLPS